MASRVQRRGTGDPAVHSLASSPEPLESGALTRDTSIPTTRSCTGVQFLLGVQKQGSGGWGVTSL